MLRVHAGPVTASAPLQEELDMQISWSQDPDSEHA